MGCSGYDDILITPIVIFCFSDDTKMIILENKKQYKKAVSKIKKGRLFRKASFFSREKTL